MLEEELARFDREFNTIYAQEWRPLQATLVANTAITQAHRFVHMYNRSSLGFCSKQYINVDKI